MSSSGISTQYFVCVESSFYSTSSSTRSPVELLGAGRVAAPLNPHAWRHGCGWISGIRDSGCGFCGASVPLMIIGKPKIGPRYRSPCIASWAIVL